MSDADDDSLPKTAFDSADPPRNFTLDVSERIRAITIGAPAWATRKKHIEDLEERWIRALVALHDTLVLRGHGDLAGALVDRAATFDLKKINCLIEIHNRYYPIEASLPLDPRTGDYVVYGRRWAPEEPWTAARLVEHAWGIIAARAERNG